MDQALSYRTRTRTLPIAAWVALHASSAFAQTPSAAPARAQVEVAPAQPSEPAIAPSEAQPGATPPIGPIDAPTESTAPAQAAPTVAPATPSFEPPAGAGGVADETELDVPFELQSLKDDQQGLQTDLENFKFQWQRERDLHTAITTRPLVINGVIQTRFSWTDQDANGPTVHGRRSTFDIGSALIGFTGNLYKDYEEGRNLSYSLGYGASPQTNTNNSFLNLTNANITYSLLPTIDREAPALTVTLGQQLLPFGLEVAASEELKPVIRNAEFATQMLLGRRDIGLVIKGDLFPQMDYGFNYRQALIAYSLGVLNGAGPNTGDDNDSKDIIGRLAFTVPSDYHSWLRQITIGGTAYWGKKNVYLTDPAKTLAGKGVKQRYGVDIYYNHWPFGLTYEFIVGRDVVTTGTSLAEPKRAEITSRAHVATVFLSFGEQFVTGFRNQGRYDDWWPKTYQPFVRFDSYDRNTRDATTNDRIDTLTIGLNVFFAETTKLQINYNRRDDQQLELANELFAQFQFGF